MNPMPLDKMRMMHAAARIVDVCANVQPGEKVFLLTDTGMDPDIPEVIALACAQRGADVALMTIAPRAFHGAQPPDVAAGAMFRADVILEVTSVFIGHSQARFDACDAGARYLAMPELSREMMTGPSGFDADFHSLVPMVTKLKQKVTEASAIRLTTAAGTDLSANISGRPARGLHCLVHNKGDFAPPPDVEVSVSPVEEAAQGKVVVDGFVVGVGIIEEPITIIIKKGMAVSIEGGGNAAALKRMLDSAQDPNAFALCEIGLGLNPKADLRRGTTLEAEGTYGTAHIALGGKPWPEARLLSPLHIDLVFRNVTAVADGITLIENGEVTSQFR